MESITSFIHSIIPDVRVIFEDNEYYVNVEGRVINVGINPDPEGDRLIHEFVLEKFGVSMHPALIGILHEIGHIMTFNPDVYAEGEALYFLLSLSYDSMAHEEYSRIYFSIPNEFAATEWAVNYYLSHKEKCDNFMAQGDLL